MKTNQEKPNNIYPWYPVFERSPKCTNYYLTCCNVWGHPQCVGLVKFDAKAQMWIDDEKDEPIYPSDITFEYWTYIPEFGDDRYKKVPTHICDDREKTPKASDWSGTQGYCDFEPGIRPEMI